MRSSDLGRSDVLGQRKLNEDPVDRGIGIEPVDQREQLGFGRPAGRSCANERMPASRRRGACCAHRPRGGILADQHDRKPRPAAAMALERIRPGPNLAPELLRNSPAIDDLGAHKPAALLKSPTRRGQHGNCIAFGRREMRIPDVNDQDDARTLAAVPGFVLISVVERNGLALAPFVPLAADDERAVLGDNEREVTDDAGIGDSPVRQDVRARSQHREHHFRRVFADPDERQ